MGKIKYNQAREMLQSGNVVNCNKRPLNMYAKEMYEDFEVETLEHQNAPYKGKKGDYLMISPSGEMYVCDKAYFEENYVVSSFFNIRQFAGNMEDYHFGLGQWANSPFTDETIQKLRERYESKRSERVPELASCAPEMLDALEMTLVHLSMPRSEIENQLFMDEIRNRVEKAKGGKQ